MAAVLEIGEHDGTTLVDLINGTFTIYRDQWQTRFRGDVVDEIMTIVANDTDANIMTAEDAIDDAAEAVDAYLTNPLDKDPIWLYNTADGETDTKRSLILSISLEPISVKNVHQLLGGFGAYRKLIITHHPAYEDEDDPVAAVITHAYANGVGSNYIARAYPQIGTLPARIRYMMLERAYSGAYGPFYRAWFGIREFLEGYTQFKPIIDCETTVNGGAAVSGDGTDMTDTALAGTHNSYYARCSFGTEAMTKRVAMRLDNTGSTDTDHFIGRYLVLLRCRMSDASTVVGIRAWAGFYSTDDSLYSPIGDEIYLENNSNWLHREVGEVQIPPFPLWGGSVPGSMDKFTIQIHAERISGSGYLDLDCIVLVPSRRLAYVEGGYVQYNGASDYNPMWIYTTENDEIAAYAERSNYPANNVVVSLSGERWDMPVSAKGNNVIVVVAEQETSHIVSDVYESVIYTQKRWRTRRGS